MRAVAAAGPRDVADDQPANASPDAHAQPRAQVCYHAVEGPLMRRPAAWLCGGRRFKERPRAKESDFVLESCFLHT